MENDLAYLFDILESAELAIDHLSGITVESFRDDIKSQDAVIRRLEIIGEASGKVSKESQHIYRDLPWQKMKGMRNFLIHEYDDIDINIVWETVKHNLPPIIKQLKEILPPK
ncbi:MAG TPA: DUF86 domain-containing protein [Ignavibacteria bacterium]|nr:DUF86 domain-containing protein [Ignavibacteria bacterium]